MRNFPPNEPSFDLTIKSKYTHVNTSFYFNEYRDDFYLLRKCPAKMQNERTTKAP